MFCKINLIKLLTCAYKKGNLNIIRSLHENLNLTVDDFGKNCEFLYVHEGLYGHLDILKYLFGIVGLKRQDFEVYGNHMLLFAIKYGYFNIVEYLIEIVEIDVNSIKLIACCRAIIHNKVEIFKYLIECAEFITDKFTLEGLPGNSAEISKYIKDYIKRKFK